MKNVKKVNTGLAWARKEPYDYEGKKYDADIQAGDKIKILKEESIVPGQWGDQRQFPIETRNGEKGLGLNQSTINVLIDTWGDESKNWIGKELNILIHKTIIAGEKKKVVYAVPEGWYLDEYGELVNDNVNANQTKENPTPETPKPTGKPDYPEENIDPETIPF